MTQAMMKAKKKRKKRKMTRPKEEMTMKLNKMMQIRKVLKNQRKPRMVQVAVVEALHHLRAHQRKKSKNQILLKLKEEL